MSWLTNWDDLIHGTAVFGAAVPFFVGLLLGAFVPGRIWIAVVIAMAIPSFWLFGWPSLPPESSDHAVVTALLAASALLACESALKLTWWSRIPARLILWIAIGWSLYPNWLAQEGGVTRRLLVAGAMGLTITVWALVMETLMRETGGDSQAVRSPSFTPAALIPPTVALSALLQLGGSMQFAQSTGALASSSVAVCAVMLWKRSAVGLRPVAGLWAMLFGLLAWSGWLFAEVHLPAVLTLLAAPLVAVTASYLPRKSPSWSAPLQEAILSAAIAGLALWLGWAEYNRTGEDSMGY